MNTEKLDRRGFLKGAALCGGLVATAGLAACATEGNGNAGTGGVGGSTAWDREVDVAILGASTGGMIAAAKLVSEGKKVVVVEAGKETGGTALISSGGITRLAASEERLRLFPDAQGLPLLDTLDEYYPQATDFVLSEVYPDAMPIAQMLATSADEYGLYMGGTYELRREYFDVFDDYIKDNGGEILLETKAFRLIQDDSNRTIGTQVRDAAGKMLRIGAKATIVCTGGFQANPEKIQNHYGLQADNAVCRAVPYNDGAGIDMALEVGAKLSKGHGSTYGHETLAYPILTYNSFADPAKAIADYEAADKDTVRNIFSSQNAFDGLVIHLNLDGRRFYDEGYALNLFAGYSSYINNNAILQQPFARAFSIFDSQLISGEGTDVRTSIGAALDNIKKVGATLVEADTLEGLITKLNAGLPLHQQVPVLAALRTIEEYNAAVAQGPDALAALNPPRTSGADTKSIATPPFYAIPITAGISATQGGLAVDSSLRVLERGSNVPIAGLYAIPYAAGGVQYFGYHTSALCVMHSLGYAVATVVNGELG